MTKAIMIQGTASHVGKSILTAALGRWFADRGFRVAPFKAQNMSLNSFVTLRGEEIARSQAAQAAALGIEPTADMNPVLLKPLQTGCQVLLRGQPIGVMSIHEYYAFKATAWKTIIECYDRLASNYDVIVLEGAGSPAEINLREHDLVNMRMAHYANAKVILITDIERGGAFAQLIGTWELLEPRDRDRIAGFIINKFRGDSSLLTSGLEYIEQRTGRSVLGVLPFENEVQIEEEDSLGLPEEPTWPPPADAIDIAVLRLPGISNFTDIAPLQHTSDVHVRFVENCNSLGRPDLIILPGTRTTVRALNWLRETGLADRTCDFVNDPDGPFVVGICGGYQILGRRIYDPENIESDKKQENGLNLLPISTHFQSHKTLCRVKGAVAASAPFGHSTQISGYMIYHGRIDRHGGQPLLNLISMPDEQQMEEGAASLDGRVFGTSVHGLFDESAMANAILTLIRKRKGLPGLRTEPTYSTRMAQRYAFLPGWLDKHCPSLEHLFLQS